MNDMVKVKGQISDMALCIVDTEEKIAGRDILLFINCNWAYARWQCYKNWTYIQEMDIQVHSKETKHISHEETAYLTKFHSTVQVQQTEYKVQ
jgi:hypothetical protein